MRTRGLAAAVAMILILVPTSAEAKATKIGARCYTTNSQVKTESGFLKCLKNAGTGYRTWTAVTASGKILKASVAKPLEAASDLIIATPPPESIAPDSASAPAVAAPLPTPEPVTVTADPVVVVDPAVVVDPVPTVIVAPPAVVGPSGYEIVVDPNNGGSPEVVYPDPVTTEQKNPALPVAVTGLTVSNLTENSLDVSFTGVSGVDTFQVYLRYDDSFTLKGTDAVNTSVHFDQLSPGWDYVTCVYYRLTNVESEKACQNIHTPGTTPHWQNYLDGPTGVVATAVDNTIEVSWNALANADRYGVCIYSHDACQCGGYTELDSPLHIRFNDGSVSYPGSRYEVRVYAILTTGEMTVESKAYVTANGTVPAPPALTSGVTNLHVTDVTPTSVTVAWDLPTDHTVNVWQVVARYNTSYQATGTDGNATSFTVSGLSPGLGYEIYLEGFDGSLWTTRTSTSVILPAQQ